MAARSPIAGAARRGEKRLVTARRRDSDFGTGERARVTAGALADITAAPTNGTESAPAACADRLSGATLLHQAMAVAAAADAYSARGPQNISALTLQFLIGRSLELAFRAYLTNVNGPDAGQGEIALNLSVLLEQANAHAFEFHGGTSDADRRAVAALGPNYMRKMIERPRIAGIEVVTAKALRETLHRAIAAVFMAIWKEDPLRINLRRASDRALGLCIADDACYEEPGAGIGGG